MKNNILKVILLITLIVFSGCDNLENKVIDNKAEDNNVSKTIISWSEYNSSRDYILSRRIITKTNYTDKVIIDWCLGTQVWREFSYFRKGSFSQIIVVESGTSSSSIPLTCNNYSKYKDKI